MEAEQHQGRLLSGQRFGVYHLQDRIGAGGMGEVYRARDTRLGREVAVKVLLRTSTDPGLLARFEREARLLASLNHPNVATIHGVEESGGIRAIVMELVDGQTLAERLVRERLSVADSLAVARQLADALEAAHEKGIIHRDLKPSNIKITSGGSVKVLDFGIAKALIADSAETEVLTGHSITVDATREGMVVGTAAYMSPEQARGQTIDRRTDIWAFGCVLYEMLTGRVAFGRATTSDTIAAILEHEPDWQVVPAGAPAAVSRLLRRCLAKEPARRLRDIADARLEIEEIQTAPPASATGAWQAADSAATHRRFSRMWIWAGAGFAAGIVAAAAVALTSINSARLRDRPAQFTLTFGRQAAGIVATTVPIPSPDSRHFVFVGRDDTGVSSLWVRPFESADARRLSGTEGGETPIWSPDGRWIAFYADGRLKKVSVSGGQPQTIAALPGFQEAGWGSKGDIIFRPGNRQALFRIPQSGGNPTAVTQLNAALAENSHRGLSFLPDGRRFLFTSRCAVPENNALYIASLDSPGVRRVMSLQSKAVFIPGMNDGPSALLYYRDGGLEARPFDAEREGFTGDAQPVIADVDYNAVGIRAFFEAAADGRVIVVQPSGAGDSQLTWFQRRGEQTGTLGAPGDVLQPRISPRGDRVAFTRPDPRTGNRDVWTIDVSRGIAANLTVHPANDWHAVWSPDASQLVFGSDRGGVTDSRIYVKGAADSGAEESVLHDGPGMPTDWSRDGRWITVGGTGVQVVAASGDRKAFTFVDTPFRDGAARFSPDGKWIAYVSDETGRFEVFVRPFAEAPADTGRKIQVSDRGGDYPVWRSDGNELYYMSGNFTIYAVRTNDLRKTGTVPRPERLFRACPGSVPFLPSMQGSP
jgi:Tol biopolymer transport system component